MPLTLPGRSSKYRNSNASRMPQLARIGRFFDPSMQYVTTVIGGIILTGFMFSGFLLFRYADTEDLVARGKQQMVQGKVALAARTFQTLLNKDPNNYEGHLLLGNAFLELDDRWQAEKEFQAAALLRNKGKDDSGAEVAMSKLAMVEKDYPKAEGLLLKAYGKLRRNNDTHSEQLKELQQGLFDLYENWGDSLMGTNSLSNTVPGDTAPVKENKDYASIIDRYERALRYVTETRLEDRIKEKLIEATGNYANQLSDIKDYAHAVQVMQKSLRYRYLPETLVQIANDYEHLDNLDEAINWYRKAFDANPSTISIRLTNVLMKKGRLLMDAKKPDEAQRYFDEADQVSKRANLPPEVLYPVKVTTFQIISNYDEPTGKISPKVNLQVENDGDRSVNFLAAKATFSSGDTIISEKIVNIANPDNPLKAKGKSDGKASVTLVPDDALTIHRLSHGQLKVTISLAYNEDKDPADSKSTESAWKTKAIQEITIKKREATPAKTDDTSSAKEPNNNNNGAPPLPSA